MTVIHFGQRKQGKARQQAGNRPVRALDEEGKGAKEDKKKKELEGDVRT